MTAGARAGEVESSACAPAGRPAARRQVRAVPAGVAQAAAEQRELDDVVGTHRITSA